MGKFWKKLEKQTKGILVPIIEDARNELKRTAIKESERVIKRFSKNLPENKVAEVVVTETPPESSNTVPENIVQQPQTEIFSIEEEQNEVENEDNTEDDQPDVEQSLVHANDNTKIKFFPSDLFKASIF